MPKTIRYPHVALNNGVELPALGLGVRRSHHAARESDNFMTDSRSV